MKTIILLLTMTWVSFSQSIDSTTIVKDPAIRVFYTHDKLLKYYNERTDIEYISISVRLRDCTGFDSRLILFNISRDNGGDTYYNIEQPCSDYKTAYIKGTIRPNTNIIDIVTSLTYVDIPIVSINKRLTNKVKEQAYSYDAMGKLLHQQQETRLWTFTNMQQRKE